MSKPATGDERDDGIELRPTRDGGWAWVDTRSDGQGPDVIDTVEDVEYAALSCVVNGVDHLQITRVDAESEAAGTTTDCMIRSSQFYDLDQMR